ncbi:MAG: type 11 methyltransferase [Parcubacteria group bacterium Gr01-1014_72]|nr:MAG: type 11 methyltransferase [Parcubacteria group bacterium Gr01-1014_72]
MRTSPGGKAERLFHLPRLYHIKITALNAVNGMTSFSLNEETRGKDVLDIGCGAVQYLYDPRETKSRTAIDPSVEMIEQSKLLYPNDTYRVASAETLPFPDKHFDVALFLFVLHHIEPGHWERALAEARRVSRGVIIILDHTLSHHTLPALIQTLWWRIFDGGKSYRTEHEWQELLSGYSIADYRRMGALFSNICYFKLKVR